MEKFIEYFNKFYGLKGIYSNGQDFTEEQIVNAINYLKRIEPGYKFIGDSYDRELIKDAILYKEKI
jgi:hypothetical protein